MAIEPHAQSADGSFDEVLCTHRSSEGYEIAYRLWKPRDTIPRGQILALHGIQSHSGWYEASCRQLAESGFEVWFPDRRGSGRNAIERGHVTELTRWFDDINEFIVLMSQNDDPSSEREPTPKFLLGLSWGAKLALAHTVVRPYSWRGVILLYPGIYTRINIKWWQKIVIGTLFRLGLKRMRIAIPLDDPRLFAWRPEAQQRIERDQMALHQVTISFLYASGQLDRLALAAPKQLHLPTFCQLAGRDEIVDMKKTRTFLKLIESSDLTVLEYSDARHTLEFEPNREQITGDLVHWLDRVLSHKGLSSS